MDCLSPFYLVLFLDFCPVLSFEAYFFPLFWLSHLSICFHVLSTVAIFTSSSKWPNILGCPVGTMVQSLCSPEGSAPDVSLCGLSVHCS